MFWERKKVSHDSLMQTWWQGLELKAGEAGWGETSKDRAYKLGSGITRSMAEKIPGHSVQG